jgi:hypothetical protein
MEMVGGNSTRNTAGKKIATSPSNGAMKAKYRLALLVCLSAALSTAVRAQAFRFEVGSPVASQDFRLKMAAFVFRTTGCPEPGKVEVSATGEGLVGTERRSVAMDVKASSTKPGVYAVQRQWDTGQWVVILKGSCGEAKAGAIVLVGPSGFARDASKFYTHTPTAAEVDAVLKAIKEGGNR